jgi:DNA-binding PadR family transcriptional regulator
VDFNDCPCTGRNLTKLVKPMVMALLAQGQLHGYALQQEMEEKASFIQGAPDLSGIYRSLKEMEGQGYVESSWVTCASGPAKRCFTLTNEGRACLAQWRETLAVYRDQINELLRFIDELNPPEAPAPGGPGRAKCGCAENC